MNREKDPFDLIRAEAKASEPTDAARERTRRRLLTVIAADRGASRPARIRYAWAASAAVVAIGVLAILIARPSQVEATLVEVARAARAATPHEVPQGSFLYTASERADLVVRPGQDFEIEDELVAYLLSSTREVWQSAGFVQIRTTATSVSFFDPEHEAAYYTQGLEALDQIEVPVLEQFTGVDDPTGEHQWPTTPSLLRQEMEEYTSGQVERTLESRILELAATILREADPAPELRGALFEVLAALELDVIDESADLITLRTASGTGEFVEVTVDRQGRLVAEATTLLNGDPALGVPELTVVSRAIYSAKALVTDLSPPR